MIALLKELGRDDLANEIDEFVRLEREGLSELDGLRAYTIAKKGLTLLKRIEDELWSVR